MIFIDGGACVGERVELFSKYLHTCAVCGTHTIYAFEPLTINFKRLVEAYGNTPGVFCVQAALGNSTGTTDIYTATESPDKDYRGATVITDKYQKSFAIEKVPIIKLSDYWKEHIGQKVDVLKLNIEGFEYDVFEDLLNAGIINKFDYIIYEDHCYKHDKKIDSVANKAKVIFPRLVAEFRGKLEFMHGGQWNVSQEKPEGLRKVLNA